MPRPSVGHGANWGYNFGGGGIIYLSDLNPPPNGAALENSFSFKIGVNGALIDLSTVSITINGETAFLGSVPGFVGAYNFSSSYAYHAASNGYTFLIVRDGGYPISTLSILVEAETFDGASTTQTYSITAAPSVVYPSVPIGVELGRIPLNSFTGEATDPPLGEAAGLVFLSAPMTPRVQSPAGSVDFDSAEVKTQAYDSYVLPDEKSTRPFLLGPFKLPTPDGPDFPPVYSSSYQPVLNDLNFGFMRTSETCVRGVLTNYDTMEETVILY